MIFTWLRLFCSLSVVGVITVFRTFVSISLFFPQFSVCCQPSLCANLFFNNKLNQLANYVSQLYSRESRLVLIF